jgi:solute carrier family 39 (zinc transporter), member 1/2/3
MFGNECLGELTYEATAAAVAMAGIFLSFLVEYLGHRFVLAKGGNATRTALVSVYVLEAGIIFHSLSRSPPSRIRVPTYLVLSARVT